MKIELKSIIEQLNEVINLDDDLTIVACFDDNNEIFLGWTVARLDEYGLLHPIYDKVPTFKTLKEIFKLYEINYK